MSISQKLNKKYVIYAIAIIVLVGLYVLNFASIGLGSLPTDGLLDKQRAELKQIQSDLDSRTEGLKLDSGDE